MSRLKSDMLLLLTAIIWGGAFVAQKDAFSHIGACTFVAARFFISFVLVLPFAVAEWRRKRPGRKLAASRKDLALVSAAFSAAVILQQAGIASTSVTNAGFLTGLYVIFVPIICRVVYRQKLSRWIYPAALLSVAGTWLLSGGVLSPFSPGDSLVVLCAVGFAVQVSMIGAVTRKTSAPLIISCLQYAAVALAAGVWAVFAEHPAPADLVGAIWPILYAGVLSGGVAYTLQVVAQQYAPAADAAIIMSGESLFAAIAGAVLMSERLTSLQYAGCALICGAIFLAEAAPLLRTRRSG